MVPPHQRHIFSSKTLERPPVVLPKIHESNGHTASQTYYTVWANDITTGHGTAAFQLSYDDKQHKERFFQEIVRLAAQDWATNPNPNVVDLAKTVAATFPKAGYLTAVYPVNSRVDNELTQNVGLMQTDLSEWVSTYDTALAVGTEDQQNTPRRRKLKLQIPSFAYTKNQQKKKQPPYPPKLSRAMKVLLDHPIFSDMWRRLLDGMEASPPPNTLKEATVFHELVVMPSLYALQSSSE